MQWTIFAFWQYESMFCKFPDPPHPHVRVWLCVTINATNHTQHLVLVYMYIRIYCYNMHTSLQCISTFLQMVEQLLWCTIYVYILSHTYISTPPPPLSLSLFSPLTHMHEYSHIQCKCTCVHTLCYSGDHSILKLFCASYMYGVESDWSI